MLFIQKGILPGISINWETINSVLPLTKSTSEGLISFGAELEKGTDSSVKNAFIFLFLSNKLNSLFFKLKKISISQLIKFIFKALSSLLLWLLFIYYSVDPTFGRVILSNLATITLYDLAKI